MTVLGLKATLLSPLLLLQGLWVYFKTPRLPEAAGERAGISGTGTKDLCITILGDSAAAGVGVEKQSQALSGNLLERLATGYRVEWRLIAWNGCKTADMVRHINQQIFSPADIVVTSLGVNDVTSSMTPTNWLSEQQVFIDLVREKLSPSHIIITAVPSMEQFPALPGALQWYLGNRASAFNQMLAVWVAEQQDCDLLNLALPDVKDLMATDGFHPGERGYRLWAEEIVAIMNKKLKQSDRIK